MIFKSMDKFAYIIIIFFYFCFWNSKLQIRIRNMADNISHRTPNSTFRG